MYFTLFIFNFFFITRQMKIPQPSDKCFIVSTKWLMPTFETLIFFLFPFNLLFVFFKVNFKYDWTRVLYYSHAMSYNNKKIIYPSVLYHIRVCSCIVSRVESIVSTGYIFWLPYLIKFYSAFRNFKCRLN